MLTRDAFYLHVRQNYDFGLQLVRARDTTTNCWITKTSMKIYNIFVDAILVGFICEQVVIQLLQMILT